MRCSSRWASSSRPASFSSCSRSCSSTWMPFSAWLRVGLRRHIMRIGENLDAVELVGLLAGQRIELDDALDLVAEQLNPPGAVFQMRREQLDGVAAHPEGAAGEVHIGALILQGDEIGEELALLHARAALQLEGHRGIGLDRADTVDARHRGDDDHVVALQQSAGGGVAHPVDLLVDRGFLLDIGVGARDVGLRLVVVVIGDEILDRVVREEALELAIELRGERLVRGQDQRGALGRLDHLRHGESLARAGDAEQHLIALMLVDAGDQFLDGGRLIALRIELRSQVEADAALGFLRPLRTMRRKHRHHPRDDRVIGHGRKLRGAGNQAAGSRAGLIRRRRRFGEGFFRFARHGANMGDLAGIGKGLPACRA